MKISANYMRATNLKNLIVDAWKSGKPENVFLAISIPVISLFIIIIPAMQGWDEATHFLRAYQVSEKNFIPEKLGDKNAGGMTPVDIVQMHDAAITDLVLSAQSNLERKARPGYYFAFIKDVRPSEQRVEKTFEGSAVYSPVSYIPQSLGIFIARNLHLPLLLYVYMGRLFNAALFVLLVYFSIKIIPRGKWVMFAVALLPTSLTAAATLSPDALINSAALLLVSVFIYGLLGKNPLDTKYLLLITALTIVLSLTKQSYFLFGLLFLFAHPVKVFGSLKRYITWNLIFVILSIGLTLGWYLVIKDISHLIHVAHKPDQFIDSSSQIKFILNNPLSYIWLLIEQFTQRINPQYIQLVGSLTWKAIAIPNPIIFLIYLGLLISFATTYIEDKTNITLSKSWRRTSLLAPVVLGFVIVVLVYTSLYLTFNEVGKLDRIEGIQGRYFLPLIPLLIPPLLLSNPKREISTVANKKFLESALVNLIVIQSTVALFVVFATNYIPNVKFI